MEPSADTVHREPWNKGKIVGQKAPFKIQDIWALRVRLKMEGRARELALFNLGIDSKLRGCDLVALKVRDVCHGGQVATRGVVMQRKTHPCVVVRIRSRDTSLKKTAERTCQRGFARCIPGTDLRRLGCWPRLASAGRGALSSRALHVE